VDSSAIGEISIVISFDMSAVIMLLSTHTASTVRCSKQPCDEGSLSCVCPDLRFVPFENFGD